MSKKSLAEWLEIINKTHNKKIDLSLERVLTVAKRLKVDHPSCQIVVVGGTNGKGSCVAGLEAIYVASGYKVGSFSSPFLFQFNEQIKIQGIPVEDEMICQAFSEVEKHCHEVTLTPFEWTTLAAFLLFKSQNLDIWILEVGLGGRFDAVNILNADVSIITSISMDHMEWLGNTREAIAYEKAGICRPDKPAICGDLDPPYSLTNRKVKKWYCQNREFGFHKKGEKWQWWSENTLLDDLPYPLLALPNMSIVLMTVELLQEKLPISKQAIIQGLETARLIGRIQVIPGDISIIYDVSHNPASAEWLSDFLKRNNCQGKTRAVFSMLADKDILSTLNTIKENVDIWDIASLPIERGSTRESLMDCFKKAKVKNVKTHATIENAFSFSQKTAKKDDRIVVFGSFHTVSTVMAFANKGQI